MKKNLIAATLVALFLTVGAKAQKVENTNEDAVIDVIMSLNPDVAPTVIPMYQKFMIDLVNVNKSEKLNDIQKKEKIEDLKDEYADKFSYYMDSDQNAIIINNIPFEYINSRL